jgi:hypothetical protein
MNGGIDFRQPLHVQKVTPDGVAYKAGLRTGDVLRQICTVPTHGMTHEQAKMEIIRAGNELDFFVERGGMSTAQMEEFQYAPEPKTTPAYEQTHVHDPALQSRSLKVIQRSLRME